MLHYTYLPCCCIETEDPNLTQVWLGLIKLKTTYTYELIQIKSNLISVDVSTIDHLKQNQILDLVETEISSMITLMRSNTKSDIVTKSFVVFKILLLKTVY